METQPDQRSLDWRLLAACAGIPDVDAIFFPERETEATATAARRICAACPVTAECLAFAVETGSRGVFAGLTSIGRQGRKVANLDAKRSVNDEEITGIRDRQICELTLMRHSASEVADRLGTNERTVGRVLASHGVEAYS